MAADGDVERLVAEATERGLADAPGWHALLHYRPDRFGGGVTSYADTPSLFLSERGRTDPEAELRATLEALFAPDPAGDAPHPQCRFPARLAWLDEELDLDATSLERRRCEAYEEWLGAIEPRGLTLIFPEAYVNNPSSTFGHTLLRVDRAETGAGADLAAYSINYAAAADEELGPVYAVRGIFGGYPGRFTIDPYYVKVKQYGDFEHRDLWEYRLDFTRAEVERVLAHVWELEGVDFDYYYFDENCAQVLLRLLRVARPRDAFDRALPRPWVLPIDTVRVALDEAGTGEPATYRPSLATSLRFGERTAPPEVVELAVALSTGELSPDAAELAALDPEARALALTLAEEHVRFQALDEQLERGESVPRLRRLLIAISREPPLTERTAPPRPTTEPQDGHGAERVTLSGGVEDGEGFVELRLRPAFHGGLDPWPGFIRGSEVTFLEVATRWRPEASTFRLEELSVLDVASLAPRGAFLRPIAWRFRSGLRTRLVPTGPGERGPLGPEPVGRIDGGAGVAYEPWSWARLYGLAEVTAEAGPALDRSFSAGPGATVGALLGAPDGAVAFDVSARFTAYLLGERTERTRVGVDGRVALSRSWAVGAGVELVRDYDETRLDGLGRLHYYP